MIPLWTDVVGKYIKYESTIKIYNRIYTMNT